MLLLFDVLLTSHAQNMITNENNHTADAQKQKSFVVMTLLMNAGTEDWWVKFEKS